jgi:CheY-like chemotaxis protein
VVEDNEDACHTLCLLLKSRGYKVEAAGTVQTAISLAGRQHFDLLLADLGLPDGDGLTLLETMRRFSPGLQGIAVSGYGMPHDLENSRQAGFAAHLVKPVRFSELRVLIETLVPATKAAALRQMRTR